jgi:hypothetical protein
MDVDPGEKGGRLGYFRPWIAWSLSPIASWKRQCFSHDEERGALVAALCSFWKFDTHSARETGR